MNAIEIKDSLITINTDRTSYQMKVSPYGHLLHTYYGRKISGDMSYLLTYYDRGYSPNVNDAGMDDRTYSMDCLPLEYSCFGNGDFRTSSIIVCEEDGAAGIDLRFEEAKIEKGKYRIASLPSAYENPGDDAESLYIVLKDIAGLIKVTLMYAVFPHTDIITRHALIENISGRKVTVKKAASLELDMISGKYELIHFCGRYGMERGEERGRIAQGLTVLTSRRGISSHQENPFFILAGENTCETMGEAYGFSLLYSGDFKNEIEIDPYRQLRVVTGISDEMFDKCLAGGESFSTPEAVMSYTDAGFESLSYNFHRLVRKNICRGPYRDSRRPVLINNWEATYFDFTGDRLVSIAKQAQELGVEMFVLDDGWFGERSDDKSSLGDWYVNEKKLGGTLKNAADRIRKLGMKFGLWIEPEMISENSKLYREHPDYAFALPNRAPVRGRSQLVLDFTRKEVVDCIFDMITKVIDDTGVDYLKIDMNRSIHEVYSREDKCQSRGVLLHEYVLGMYDFLDRLCRNYPDMLIEGCCGGGGRFDMGMLYYVPQIWCSDNTDAIERLSIQHGTSFGYPMSSIGAHVSAVPNHQTGRITPIRTRGTVAMCGGFGYELDLNLISEEEKADVRVQIANYKKCWPLILNGRYYRLTDPLSSPAVMASMYALQDGSEAIVLITAIKAAFNSPVSYIKLRGLSQEALYHIDETDITASGAALMNGGIPVPAYAKCEHDSMMMHVSRIS